MPERIQLKRAKGWRMPPNTVRVDRLTKWGNPYRIPQYANSQYGAVVLYRQWLNTSDGRMIAKAARSELPGKNLACWCKPGTFCHGDVLLEVANGEG